MSRFPHQVQQYLESRPESESPEWTRAFLALVRNSIDSPRDAALVEALYRTAHIWAIELDQQVAILVGARISPRLRPLVPSKISRLAYMVADEQ